MTIKRKNRRNRRPEQLSMFEKTPKTFGGGLLKGNPKTQRPLSIKAPLHVVLKTRHGFGKSSMLHPIHVKTIDQCVRKHAQLNGVRIYHFVNVGNHIHLVVRIHDRRRFKVFIRSVTGVIARKITGRQRGKARGEALKPLRDKPLRGYWLNRPFTRIASWGRDYQNLGRYMIKNQRQVERFGMNVARRSGSQVEGFDRLTHPDGDLYQDTA